MVRYFIGNVLSPTETQPEQHDPTFAFTSEEAKNLDLCGKPIRMEHDPEMEVGTIIKNWQAEDGSVWVTGKLNDDSLESKFATYAIEKNPYTGTCYYTGLSLQHTHTQYASSGSSKKEAIEVSLCVNPRRSDCRIAFVDSDLKPDKTKKIVYKIHKASFKQSQMSESLQTTETTETTETPMEPKNEEMKDETTNMSREDMMKVIIDQQKQLETTQNDQNAKLEEYEKLKEMLKKQEEEEMQKEQEKAYALSKALVDQWAETLDATEMDEASREAVMKMAKDYPKQSMELLKVAHCASKKYTQMKSQFKDYKQVMQRDELQEKFKQVMARKRPAPVKKVHAASKKQKVGNVEAFLTAMEQYKVSGSARDHMSEVSQIGRRRNTFY